MPKAEYIRKINQSSLLLTPDKEYETEKDSIGMFRYHEIPDFLKLEVKKKNTNAQFCYDITSKRSLEQLLEYKSLDYLLLLKILSSFDHACIQTEDYMMTEDDILLEPEFVFVDHNIEKMSYCYLPGNRVDICIQFKGFMGYLLQHLDHRDKQAVQLAYYVYQRVVEDQTALHNVLEGGRFHEPAADADSGLCNVPFTENACSYPSNNFVNETCLQNLKVMEESEPQSAYVMKESEPQSAYVMKESGPQSAYAMSRSAYMDGKDRLADIKYRNNLSDLQEQENAWKLQEKKNLRKQQRTEDIRDQKRDQKKAEGGMEPQMQGAERGQKQYDLENAWKQQKSENAWNLKEAAMEEDSCKIKRQQAKKQRKAKAFKRKQPEQQGQAKPAAQFQESMVESNIRQKETIRKQAAEKLKHMLRRKIYTDQDKYAQEDTVFEADAEEEVQLHSNPTVCLMPEDAGIQNRFVYQGPDRSRDFQCMTGKMILGSDMTESDIYIPVPIVSRVHARIEIDAQGVFLEDMNSTNGTHVNGELLQFHERRILQKGDIISLAGECYSFH